MIVVTDDVSLTEMLRRLDDPSSLEWPADFQKSEATDSFERLASDVDATFATRCVRDENIADSAQFGRLEIPEEATIRGVRIVVLVSRFKPLAMVAADNPGAFLGIDEAIAEGEIDEGDVRKVEEVLLRRGYVPVPEELLMDRYDGPADLRHHGSGAPTWWDRFFGSF